MLGLVIFTGIDLASLGLSDEGRRGKRPAGDGLAVRATGFRLGSPSKHQDCSALQEFE